MIKALVFDVIGTLVDWRGSILDELKPYLEEEKAETLAKTWANFYASGDFKSKLDLYKEGAKLLELNGINLDNKEKICSIWTELKPYKDTLEGLSALKEKYKLIALTNCSSEVIVDLAKNSKLDFDELISADQIGYKKPDPKTYQFVLEKMGVIPAELMMVASHLFDLEAAAKVGFRTAYIQRREDRQINKDDKIDIVVKDLLELSKLL